MFGTRLICRVRLIVDQIKAHYYDACDHNRSNNCLDQPIDRSVCRLAALQIREKPAENKKEKEHDNSVRNPVMAREPLHGGLQGWTFFFGNHEQCVEHAAYCQGQSKGNGVFRDGVLFGVHD